MRALFSSLLVVLAAGWRQWENLDLSMYMSSPVLDGHRLYGFSHRQKGGPWRSREAALPYDPLTGEAARIDQSPGGRGPGFRRGLQPRRRPLPRLEGRADLVRRRCQSNARNASTVSPE